MRFYEDYQIDGVPLLIPDADVSVSRSDLESGDSGRDESGVMHRIVMRQRVNTWSFSYAVLTAEEYRYMEALLAGKPEFTFTYPDADGTVKSCQAYCAADSITYHNAKLGLYKNYKFDIIQC